MNNNLYTEKSYLWGAYRQRIPVGASSPVSKKNISIISTLAEEAADRSRENIERWRNNINSALDPDDPRWAQLQDQYENLSTDGHFMSCLQIRKAATLGTRFYIKNDKGEEDTEKTERFESSWFYKWMEMALDAPYYHTSVMELVNPDKFEFKIVPRRHVCPQFNRIYVPEANGEEFITYTEPAFEKRIMEITSSTKLGIVNDIVPQLIWKKNAQQTWADFSERFGIPFISIKTMETDKSQLAKIQAMANAMGQAASGVFPEGTEIDIKEPPKGDPYNVFLMQIKTNNQEVSKRILGGTMMNDDGSSRSQSEVHERTLDNKIAESDRRLIEFSVNDYLIPMLNNFGLGLSDSDRFCFDRSEQLSMKQHWEIVNGVLNKFDVDEEWIKETFNVPIIGKKQETTPPKQSKPTGLFSENFR